MPKKAAPKKAIPKADNDKSTKTKTKKVVPQAIKKLVGAPLNSPTFMTGLTDAIILYAIKLKEDFNKHYPNSTRFPDDKYLSLAEALVPKKAAEPKTGSLSGLKKKKPNMVNNETDTEVEEEADEDDAEEDEEEPVDEPVDDDEEPAEEPADEPKVAGKKGRKRRFEKKAPFSFGKNARSRLAYLIAKGRIDTFLVEEVEAYPEKQEDIRNYLMEYIPKRHPDCNVIELIILNVERYNIDGVLPNSYGLDSAIQTLFKEIKHVQMIAYTSAMLTKFIKIMTILLFNKFCIDKKSTVTGSHISQVILDMFMGLSPKVPFYPLIDNMQLFDELENPKPEPKNKDGKDDKKTSKAEVKPTPVKKTKELAKEPEKDDETEKEEDPKPKGKKSVKSKEDKEEKKDEKKDEKEEDPKPKGKKAVKSDDDKEDKKDAKKDVKKPLKKTLDL